MTQIHSLSWLEQPMARNIKSLYILFSIFFHLLATSYFNQTYRIHVTNILNLTNSEINYWVVLIFA